MESRNLLGKFIYITIDRPLGSRHPDWELIYPLNYGFVPGVQGRDGEELDAYVLGVNEPIEDFTGQCIAIIHRKNDYDDKLVLTIPGKNYTNEQIMALIKFQERFFESEIER